MLSTKAWERYKKILHVFNLWASVSLKETSTPDEKSSVKKELQIIDRAVKDIYEPRLHELRGKDYQLETNLKNPDIFTRLMGDFKAICLDLVFGGMESALKEQGDPGSPTATTGYQLIVTLFIEILRLKLLSEYDLSYFRRNTPNGKRI
jgi:hypothetical protein